MGIPGPIDGERLEFRARRGRIDIFAYPGRSREVGISQGIAQSGVSDPGRSKRIQGEAIVSFEVADVDARKIPRSSRCGAMAVANVG